MGKYEEYFLQGFKDYAAAKQREAEAEREIELRKKQLELQERALASSEKMKGLEIEAAREKYRRERIEKIKTAAHKKLADLNPSQLIELTKQLEGRNDEESEITKALIPRYYGLQKALLASGKEKEVTTAEDGDERKVVTRWVDAKPVIVRDYADAMKAGTVVPEERGIFWGAINAAKAAYEKITGAAPNAKENTAKAATTAPQSEVAPISLPPKNVGSPEGVTTYTGEKYSDDDIKAFTEAITNDKNDRKNEERGIVEIIPQAEIIQPDKVIPQAETVPGVADALGYLYDVKGAGKMSEGNVRNLSNISKVLLKTPEDKFAINALYSMLKEHQGGGQ
jgi:hypothetical protein